MRQKKKRRKRKGKMGEEREWGRDLAGEFWREF